MVKGRSLYEAEIAIISIIARRPHQADGSPHGNREVIEIIIRLAYFKQQIEVRGPSNADAKYGVLGLRRTLSLLHPALPRRFHSTSMAKHSSIGCGDRSSLESTLLLRYRILSQLPGVSNPLP